MCGRRRINPDDLFRFKIENMQVHVRMFREEFIEWLDAKYPKHEIIDEFLRHTINHALARWDHALQHLQDEVDANLGAKARAKRKRQRERLRVTLNSKPPRGTQ